jgi:hypothetical protein
MDWREWYEERAAIAEYDGGLSRRLAERSARECVLAEWNKACSLFFRSRR